MLSWNEYAGTIMKTMVPKVFMHDEMTTDGYGKCVIELMTLHGIIIKTPINESKYHWVLSNNWDKKTMLICLDGLSLERHRFHYL